MALINKELALRIARKLKAKIEKRPGRPHDLACVYEGGKLVAQFGIRRGSNRELGHDFIPENLFIGPHDARDLGLCPRSREWWINELERKGLL